MVVGNRLPSQSAREPAGAGPITVKAPVVESQPLSPVVAEPQRQKPWVVAVQWHQKRVREQEPGVVKKPQTPQQVKLILYQSQCPTPKKLHCCVLLNYFTSLLGSFFCFSHKFWWSNSKPDLWEWDWGGWYGSTSGPPRGPGSTLTAVWGPGATHASTSASYHGRGIK